MAPYRKTLNSDFPELLAYHSLACCTWASLAVFRVHGGYVLVEASFSDCGLQGTLRTCGSSDGGYSLRPEKKNKCTC